MLNFMSNDATMVSSRPSAPGGPAGPCGPVAPVAPGVYRPGVGAPYREAAPPSTRPDPDALVRVDVSGARGADGAAGFDGADGHRGGDGQRGGDAGPAVGGEDGGRIQVRLSHGVVRVAVFADELGVEYGDVVMFDGAPVGRQGGVPIFPHLATLHRRSYQIWRFVGAQATKGQLIALSKHLPEDTVIYPHTEQIVVLCDACAKGRGGDGHAHTPEQAHHVVRGKLCAPPHLAPATVLAALDAAIAGAPGAQIAVPDLCAAGEAAGTSGDRRCAAPSS